MTQTRTDGNIQNNDHSKDNNYNTVVVSYIKRFVVVVIEAVCAFVVVVGCVDKIFI